MSHIHYVLFSTAFQPADQDIFPGQTNIFTARSRVTYIDGPKQVKKILCVKHRRVKSKSFSSLSTSSPLGFSGHGGSVLRHYF